MNSLPLSLKKSSVLSISAALAVAFAGCARTPTGLTKIPGGGGAKTGTGDYASGTRPLSSDSSRLGPRDLTGGVPLADPSTFDNMTEDPSALQAYTVHFDYDSSTVKTGE